MNRGFKVTKNPLTFLLLVLVGASLAVASFWIFVVQSDSVLIRAIYFFLLGYFSSKLFFKGWL